MITALAVLAGGLGALARSELGGAIQARSGSAIPWGTFSVNVAGSVALGMLVGLALEGRVAGDTAQIVGTGFLGGFTTFSTWMADTLVLAREGPAGSARAAMVNVAAMLAAGLLAAGAGLWIGRSLA